MVSVSFEVMVDVLFNDIWFCMSVFIIVKKWWFGFVMGEL